MIDLRSDTVTKPSPDMLKSMFSATVGDDVFGDDLSVLKLEKYVAELFQVEAALFCVSGTMTNQLAIMCQVGAGEEIICDKNAHIFKYEGGGIMSNARASVKLLEGNKGRITAAQVQSELSNPDDIHQAVTRMVAVENTMNKGGGSIYDFNELVKIKEVCDKHGLIFHLDGARLFNALVETEQIPADYGKIFDSISICLSKGLGAPVGSLLLGSHELIKSAKRKRKSIGGGWRQAGYLAEAGYYSLTNNVDRLKVDHKNAKDIASVLKNYGFVKDIYEVYTNIVIFELVESINTSQFLIQLDSFGVKAVSFGHQLIRFVTHLDHKSEDLDKIKRAFDHIKF